MKRLLLGIAILALLATAVGCAAGGSSNTPSDESFGSAPWKDGDKVTYDWQGRDGSKIGTADIGFAKDGEVWVLSWADKIGALDQSFKLRIDGTTLKPLGEEKTIKAPNTDVTLNTTYQGGKLDIKAVVGGQNKNATVDVPANAIDNDQLIMTLRALQFAQGKEAKFTVIVAQSASQVPLTVRVTGKEKVDVPAGSFDAWKVELDFGQAKQYAWYQSDAPNNLVQYDNGQTKMVLTSK